MAHSPSFHLGSVRKVDKVELFEAPQFGETFRGEPVTAVQKIGRKIYLFTPTKTYAVTEPRWYERLWARFMRRIRGNV